MRTNAWLSLALLILLIPTIVDASWLPRIILVGTILFFTAVKFTYRRSAHPEVALAIALMVVEVAFAAIVVADGQQHTGALALMFWPAAGFNARYPPRVAIAATAFVAFLMIVAEVGFGGAVVWHEPIRLTALLGGLLAVTAITNAARQADLEQRRRSNRDPLTQLLNRTALESRVEDIEYQSSLRSEPVAVIVGDIDRFKSVNDQHGHARGDVVLREIAYVIRSQLRAFDPAYRLGGEEFVVLLLGSRAEAADALADRLRRAVSEQPIAGLPITISFGTATSSGEEPFDWQQTFKAADRALYEAKHAGRDRVYADALGGPVEVRSGRDAVEFRAETSAGPATIRPTEPVS